MLEDEASQKGKLEGEIAMLQSQLLQLSFEADEVCFLWDLLACCGSVGTFHLQLKKPPMPFAKEA